MAANTKSPEASLDSVVADAEIFDTKSEKFVGMKNSPNFGCECYTCQCDSPRCDCVCQGSCDAGPCYGK